MTGTCPSSSGVIIVLARKIDFLLIFRDHLAHRDDLSTVMAKKKTEKQKDFVKPKLRVGKTKAKPDNHTDTSFVAKSISLPNQSIAQKSDKNDEKDFLHQLSLTKHHSSTTRKEVLKSILLQLPSNPSLYKQILSSIMPLVHDSSQQVREEVASLLQKCAETQSGLLDLHITSVILFVHSAMSHIQPDIRSSSTKFLDIVLQHALEAVARSYFVKTLRSFFTIMSWNLRDDKKSLSLAVTTSSSIGGTSKKARVGHLAVLLRFLESTLFQKTAETTLVPINYIHPQTSHYMLPTNPHPYASLKLFTQETPQADDMFSLASLESLATDNLDTRRKIVHDVFQEPLRKNLTNLVKEGGEVGREAKSCLGVLDRLESS